MDRIQLHSNGSRGIAYLPLATRSSPDGRDRLAMRVAKRIQLDGDPLENVYANLRPIDADGDGRYSFVHFNGTRFMQVWSHSGRKLWRVENPAGYLHDMQAGVRRDPAAILDLDSDGKHDIAHCWTVNGTRSLVYRRGTDGRVIRSVPLEDSVNECEIAAFRVEGRNRPLVLVATTSAASPACGSNFIGYWARTEAYDVRGNRIWERETCNAGHYAWPVDPDRDGFAEAIFVGKYLLRPGGKLKCKLAGWPANDHVDSMAVADFQPSRPGLEVVAAGRTGVAMFDAGNCWRLWDIDRAVIQNPQHLAAARLDTDAPSPLIAIEERGNVAGAQTFLVNGAGRIKANIRTEFIPMQNADLDGARGVDELVGSFGEVMGPSGGERLSTDWFWNLRGTRVQETTSGPYPETYDRWQLFPLVFDDDRDGRDEIVQWGQSLIVIGKIAN